MGDNYCNNCGKPGHNYSNCKIPITSIGAILFRYRNPVESDSVESVDSVEYLMIRRKDTLGFIDFMRGKYSVHNRHYIINMLKQMTNDEKARLRLGNFDNLWYEIWGGNSISTQYKSEEIISRDKFNILYAGIVIRNRFYNLNILIDESNQHDKWSEAEWGFPKGRRNYLEKDFECALREFSEETGYSLKKLHNIQNIIPFEEIFTGSNYKSYKHKYYLMYMKYEDSLDKVVFEKSEVSCMEWKTYEECMNAIRPYNLEKKRLITNVHETLMKYRIYNVTGV